jgi:hypothetical protein
MHRVAVHRHQTEVDVVGFGDRPTGAMFINIALHEVFQVATQIGCYSSGFGSDFSRHEVLPWN